MWHLGSFRMHEPVIARARRPRPRNPRRAGARRGAGLGQGARQHWSLITRRVSWSWLSPPDGRVLGRDRQDDPAVGGLPALLPPRLRPDAEAEGAGRKSACRRGSCAISNRPVVPIRSDRAAGSPGAACAGAGAAAGAGDRSGAAASAAPTSSSSRRSSTSARRSSRCCARRSARASARVYAVGSWDHLSSKALIRDMPQRVFVWNETQKDEAVRLHGVPPEQVVVTGAQCYDQWFGRQPVRTREEFCRRVGLQADRPYRAVCLLRAFLGQPGRGGVRPPLGRRACASSAHPELREVGVLIRPHPARMDEWAAVDMSPFEHVSLYGSNPVDGASKDDYFESLYYSSAVVGLNTSAFLEGAVVGPSGAHRPAARVPREPGRRAAFPLPADRRRRRAAGRPHVRGAPRRGSSRRCGARRWRRAKDSCGNSSARTGSTWPRRRSSVRPSRSSLRQPAPAPEPAPAALRPAPLGHVARLPLLRAGRTAPRCSATTGAASSGSTSCARPGTRQVRG